MGKDKVDGGDCMTFKKQEELAFKISKAGLAKCIDTSYYFTNDQFNKGEIGIVSTVDIFDSKDLLDYGKRCYAISFKYRSFIHPVEFFEVPTEKEILMHQLK